MSDHFWSFLVGVWAHWAPILTGGLFSIVMLIWNKPIHRKYVVWILLAALFISCFLAWRDEFTSAEWRDGEIHRETGLLQGKDAQIQQLQSLLMQKERPINIQPDLEIGIILARQEEEISKLKGELPSPKKKALQVSNDLLNFLNEREKATPEAPLPHPGMTFEQMNQQREEYQRAYLQWMKETGNESQSRFAAPIEEVFQNMKAENIDTGGLYNFCSFFNGSTFALQRCATRIGYFAQKLSH
jgi:hypothetical protein